MAGIPTGGRAAMMLLTSPLAVAAMLVPPTAAAPAAAASPPQYVRTVGFSAHPEVAPSGLAVDSAGNLYVANTPDDQIAAFNSSGQELWAVGKRGGTGNGYFDNPRDVAVVGGSVYVADTGDNRVEVLSAASGAWQATWSYHFQGIMGINSGVDAAGKPIILAADAPRSVIDIFSLSGQLEHSFGSFGSGHGQFNQARAAATNAAGDIYVADFKNERVQELSPTGVFLRSWGHACPSSGCVKPDAFKDPYGVSVDQAGNVYVSDNIRIQKFTGTGTFLASYGTSCPRGGCTNPDELFQLRRVAVSPVGTDPIVYAADLWGDKVVEYSQTSDPPGAVQAIIGGTPPATGGFDQPFGATLIPGSDGADPTLVVVDTNNQRVESFDAWTGAYQATWGYRGYGSELDGVNWPRDITWNASTSTLWLADTKNYRVTGHAAGGAPTKQVIGTTGDQLEPQILNWTYGIASWQTGMVTADTYNNRVEAWSGSSSSEPVWTADGMNHPEAVTVAGSTVYVADTGNGRILALDASTGKQLSVLATGLTDPDGIAVAPDGDLWVSAAGRDRLVELSPTGAVLQYFGWHGGGDASFFGPAQLAIGPGMTAGTTWLYVVDSYNDRVQVFDITHS